MVGTLLFEALWQAAERGVRVRLLLDDINTRGLDPTLAALDAHPNIELLRIEVDLLSLLPIDWLL